MDEDRRVLLGYYLAFKTKVSIEEITAMDLATLEEEVRKTGGDPDQIFRELQLVMTVAIATFAG